MKFKPRNFIDPMRKEKSPVAPIDKWNPPVKEKPIAVPRATIEPNQVSSVEEPLKKMTRKPRG